MTWEDMAAKVRSRNLSKAAEKFQKQNPQSKYFIDEYSKRNPMNRMANVEDILGAVLYLASDASSYVTGHNLVVDGGMSCW